MPADARRRTLEAIHDSAVDAIITINAQGIIETVNPATETMLGYAADELIGQNVSTLMPAPYRQEHDGYLKNYRDSGIRKIIGIGREIVAQRKDGSVFPIHLAVSAVQLEDRKVFAGFIRDLTKVKSMEQREATLGHIIEESLNEVFIFDADDLHFFQVNRGARLNLGYSLEELNRLTPVDIKTAFTRSELLALLEPLRNGDVEKLELNTYHQRADGSTYEVEAHLQLSVYHTRPAFVAIIMDVSEKRKAQRQYEQQKESMQAELEKLVETKTIELNQAQAELIKNEKFATLGKVSGGIAHEIRNPLNAVKTSAYYLLHAQNPSDEKVREHLDRIDRQVSLIDNVVTTLSDVARMPEANVSPTDMESILKQLLQTTDLPSNVQTKTNFPPTLPHVLADEAQISIAFRNLIRNARDAMPDGGTITITADVDATTVKFSVIDAGSGIPQMLIEKIWEPLFSTKARGMGLGLSITRAIVEKNKGQLTVESSLGQGSQFKIELAKAEQSEATNPSEKPQLSKVEKAE